MKLLAVDTSTNSCSVALLDGERLLTEMVYTAGRTHSRHLLSMIGYVLDQCSCAVSDIGLIGVARGPGTFTGLRIGISTVKGLGLATQAAIVGVNSLAALAFPFSGLKGPIIAMIDARRNEIYWARFEASADTVEMTSSIMVAAPETVADALPDHSFLVGSGALLYRSIFESRCRHVRFADATQHIIRGTSVGMLALKQFEHRGADAADTLTPEYIRKSDAQIQISGTC